MLTFLFWNMGGKAPNGTPPERARQREQTLRAVVSNLARRHEVDLLLLAECPILPDDLLMSLNVASPQPFRPPDGKSLCERVLVFPRFPSRFLKLATHESARYTSRHLRLPNRLPLLLFAAHLPSKGFRDEPSQAAAIQEFSRTIRKLEKKAGHERTVVVGDLNVNPFESGLVLAEALNAVMSREVALRRTRTVDAVGHPFFYNPMWGLFGDSTHELYPPGHPDHEPPGTCYYPAQESRWFYWNMFDQVLLRPDLLRHFNSRELKILVSDGVTSFLDARGLPDRHAVSDHLPLLFRLHV